MNKITIDYIGYITLKSHIFFISMNVKRFRYKDMKSNNSKLIRTDVKFRSIKELGKKL